MRKNLFDEFYDNDRDTFLMNKIALNRTMKFFIPKIKS